jgi:hypothetical protein
MRADPLVGIEDRDRHAVEPPTSRGVLAVDPDFTRRLGPKPWCDRLQQPFIME